jgi:adenosylcobyric acid synthase
VAGVIPYLRVDIEDEDSLASRLSMGRNPGEADDGREEPLAAPEPIDVAVIRLPHLANFTDFMALEATRGFGVRYVSRLSELGQPDMVILPGAKNTMQDLKWLRQEGLEAAIKKLVNGGAVLFGICGGYQMLGGKISDSEGIEGGGAMAGMGLLPVITEFAPEKHRSRTRGRLANVRGPLSPLSGAEVTGYEIHMGRSFYLDDGSGNGNDNASASSASNGNDNASASSASNSNSNGSTSSASDGNVSASNGKPRQAQPLLILENGRPDGCQLQNVYGTYLHGFFDSEACRQSLLAALCRRKGVPLPQAAAPSYAQYKERQYSLLADSIRQHMDMALIYRILEAGL